MAKVNVHEIRAAPFQNRSEILILPAIDDGRFALHKFQPAMMEQIQLPFGNQLNVRKGEPLWILHLFGHDECAHAPQRSDLPVNVQHLRLEKVRAVTRNHPFSHDSASVFPFPLLV